MDNQHFQQTPCKSPKSVLRRILSKWLVQQPSHKPGRSFESPPQAVRIEVVSRWCPLFPALSGNRLVIRLLAPQLPRPLEEGGRGEGTGAPLREGTDF